MEDEIHKDDLHQARNQLNQIWWRIEANNIIQNPKVETQHAWIKNGYYWDSIVKVIGKAIGDCVTEENEFKGKNIGGKLEVIEFANPKVFEYSRENWNAVMLYNYVNVKINLPGDAHSDQELLKFCLNTVYQHYEEKYKNIYNNEKAKKELYEKLSQSKNDICMYIEALDMGSGLSAVAECKQQYYILHHSTEYISPEFGSYNNDIKQLRDVNDDFYYQYSPSYNYVKGKLYISKIKKYIFSMEEEEHEGSENFYTFAENMQKECQYALDLLDGLVHLPDDDLQQWKNDNEKVEEEKYAREDEEKQEQNYEEDNAQYEEAEEQYQGQEEGEEEMIEGVWQEEE